MHFIGREVCSKTSKIFVCNSRLLLPNIVYFCFRFFIDRSVLYGRTCKNVKCSPYELCVLAEDECLYAQIRQISCGTYPICGKLSLTDDCPCKRIAKTNCVTIIINSLYSVLSDPFWESNGKYSVELRMACHHLAEYLQNSKNNESGQENAASTHNIFSHSFIIIIITSIRNLWIVFT